MRLLRTANSALGKDVLEFEVFNGQYLPPYAILSHTWAENADDHVLFSDVVFGTYKTKRGFDKIQTTCIQDRLDGYEYCWVDTCRTEKSSSAELSEAMSSMWNYYRSAAICYEYLSDATQCDVLDSVTKSRWIKRGWT